MHDRTAVILTEVSDQPRIVLTSSGLLDELGPDNVLQSFDEAMTRAAEIASHARGTTGTHAVSTGAGH